MELKESPVKKELVSFLWVSSLSLLGGCALVVVRFALTDRFFYFFLLWNLALALVPYGIAVAIFAVSRREKTTRTYALLALLSVLWLVFYPNAPYIFTDFIHVVNRTWLRSGTVIIEKDTLLWYDLVLCSAFAFMGHSSGLMSIDLVLRSFKGVTRRWIARMLVALAVMVAGFGLYIGRFVRFNSWDLFLHPIETAGKILPYLWSPRAVLLASAFSAFILITYAVHHISRKTY
ncbi:MAG: DUF1361 domain-containing protein [Treponemataceae bacterium]